MSVLGTPIPSVSQPKHQKILHFFERGFRLVEVTLLLCPHELFKNVGLSGMGCSAI